jgi:hypothetical protein
VAEGGREAKPLDEGEVAAGAVDDLSRVASEMQHLGGELASQRDGMGVRLADNDVARPRFRQRAGPFRQVLCRSAATSAWPETVLTGPAGGRPGKSGRAFGGRTRSLRAWSRGAPACGMLHRGIMVGGHRRGGSDGEG